MSGKVLRGHWPETPPHTDDDYHAPAHSEESDLEQTQRRPSRNTAARRESGPKLLAGPSSGAQADDTTSSTGPEAESDDSGSGRQSQADKAAAFAGECELFADEQDADAIYADIVVNNHRETLRVRSAQFREWLRSKYFAAYRKGLKSETVTQAVETIVAQAKYGDERRSAPVFQRSARIGDRIYLDLCNDRWEAVEVDRDGWRVVANPDVHFCRARGMLPIPTPTTGGSIETLRSFLNVRTEGDFVLMVAWLLHALGAVPPYPLLPLGGEQGTGKSMTAEILRTLIDPNKLPIRSMPQKEDDLFVSAARSHVTVFDNLSTIPDWTSDALCRLADGSGLGKRTLYSDDEETLIMAASPILVTAIGDVVSRPDLADRSIFVLLESIPEDARRPKKDVMREFERSRPGILGALLTALSHGLRTAPEGGLDKLPRMADFAKWATACEGAFWCPGTFMNAYTANRAAAVEAVLDADELACVVRQWLERPDTGRRWSGTCTELLRILTAQVERSGRRTRPQDWPRTASGLSNRLRKIAPGLRAIGIDTKLGVRTADRRVVSFSPVEERQKSPSSSSSPSSDPVPAAACDGHDGDDGRTGMNAPRSCSPRPGGDDDTSDSPSGDEGEGQ